jgi:hypothetical protein
VNSLLLTFQSLQVWFISPQREIISVVIFGFLKSYSIIDYVNPVNVNFKDPGCCTTPDAVKTAALYFFNLSVISSSTSNPSNEVPIGHGTGPGSRRRGPHARQWGGAARGGGHGD